MEANDYELDLLRRASTGDTVAVTVLLSHYHERLRQRIALRLPPDVRRSVDADDIIQETQIQVYRSIDRFEARGADSFYRWITTIALRRLRNAIKHQRAAKRGGQAGQVFTSAAQVDSVVMLLDLMVGPDETPSTVAARQEALKSVQAALEHLSEDYRQAVQLVYLDGRSVAEAASQMGRTPRAIHNLCHKAKKHLQTLLGSASRYFGSSG